MLVYRISSEKYTNKLTSSGAANRWNQEGEFVIYSAQSRSLATLELVAHRASIRPHIKYKVMVIKINIPKSQIHTIAVDNLPEKWRSVSAYNTLQMIGSDWYSTSKKLVLEIPSAIIPQESNYIINSKHELFSSKVTIENIEGYFWDNRLL